MSVITITKDNFEKEVMNSDKPVLIDFSASWCGPCKMLSPVIDELANETDAVKICKVDIDGESELANRFEVMSVPTLIVLKNGKITNKSVGYKPKNAILEMI